MSLLDIKYQKLAAATGLNQSINDMENAWLAGLTASTGSTPDLWHTYLDAQLVPAGHLNDRQFAWLGGLGHTGTLQERWLSYWTAYV